MSNQQQETTARQPSDAAVEAAMTRLAAWVFADDPKADFSFDGVDADDKADALNAARVALEAAYRVDVPRSTPALHVTDGAVDYLGRWKWGQSYDTESPHQHEQSIAFAHEALEGLLPLLGPRPLLDRAAAIKVLGGSELAAATVDHLLSAEVVRPMPTQAELADWLRETFTADTGGTSWDLAAECLLIAMNGEA